MSAFDENLREFHGAGQIPGRAWWRGEDDRVDYQPLERRNEPLPAGHPGGYQAGAELVDAVNTALLLRRPLLVTGKPGTGKTELAERIAYELDLGAVLRFDAQSVSEANDLFYRFDHIGYLFATKRHEREGGREVSALDFVHWGPLGKAILRSDPTHEARLRGEAAYGTRLSTSGGPEMDSVAFSSETPRRSVVLIDEIDKASRDFPNDLLNGMDRMEFRIRELGLGSVRGQGRDSAFHPIVVITSNDERELPPPFLRRCVFVNIPDPGEDLLARIVSERLLAAAHTGSMPLPALYMHLLRAFVDLRANDHLRYKPGTAELLDMGRAIRDTGLDPHSVDPGNLVKLERLLGSMAKHPDDVDMVRERLSTPTAPRP